MRNLFARRHYRTPGYTVDNGVLGSVRSSSLRLVSLALGGNRLTLEVARTFCPILDQDELHIVGGGSLQRGVLCQMTRRRLQTVSRRPPVRGRGGRRIGNRGHRANDRQVGNSTPCDEGRRLNPKQFPPSLNLPTPKTSAESLERPRHGVSETVKGLLFITRPSSILPIPHLQSLHH